MGKWLRHSGSVMGLDRECIQIRLISSLITFNKLITILFLSTVSFKDQMLKLPLFTKVRHSPQISSIYWNINLLFIKCLASVPYFNAMQEEKIKERHHLFRYNVPVSV